MADICGSVSLFPFCMAYPDSCVSGSGKRIKAVGVTGRINAARGNVDTARPVTFDLYAREVRGHVELNRLGRLGECTDYLEWDQW